MDNEKKGYIYILTNPSFSEWVKIGYAEDVQQRVAQLIELNALHLVLEFMQHTK